MANKGTAQKSSATPSVSSRCRSSYQSRRHKLATLFVMTAGSANATQFPMMFIAYGGAPFLLAYLAFLGIVTFPIMRLESNLAQFAGDGNRGIFSTVPLFLGVGYSMTAYAVVRAVADTAQLSDALALLLSWTRSFEWHHDCPGGWMTRNFTCYAIRRHSTPCKVVRHHLANSLRRDALNEGIPVATGSEVLLADPRTYKEEAAACIPDLPDTASPYDFRRSSIWEQPSYDVSRAEPMFAVAAIWVLVFAVAHRGIIRLKLLFYVIILLHAVTTLMLLARACLLLGATRGLSMFVHTNWASTTNLEMWSHALSVSLESVGVTGTIYLNIERLNCFKNRFQEDVMFVLVADTASKSIGTIVSILFLGHLSNSTGINVHMLVHADFNFIVSITPQAISLGSDPEFWSRVHSLWVVSMMLPKFLIMPDIIIEVLSACHPPVLVNRRLTHFFICGFLFFLSMALSIPGGAKVFSVLSHSQNSLRFFLLVLEVVVIVQFYGVKRLAIDSRLMTNQEPGFFVKLCWTSVIPVILIALVSARLLTSPSQDRRYPPLLNMLILWVSALELSFIPVCAIVFVFCTKLSFRECLLPLPTWLPASWEQAMVYRQQLVAEDTQLQELVSPASDTLELAPLPGPPSPSPQQRMESPTQSSSDLLGTHLILTTEAKNSPSTSDWRYDSSDEREGKPPVKWHSPEKVVPDSGTFHVSRPLSSVWRSVKAKVHNALDSPPSPRKNAPKATGASRGHAAYPIAATQSPPPPPPHPASDAGQHPTTPPSPPGEHSGYAASPVSSGVVLPHVPDEDVPRDISQKLPMTGSHAGWSAYERPHVEAISAVPHQEPSAPLEFPPFPLSPEATVPAEEEALPQGDEVRGPEIHSAPEVPVYSTARQDQSKKPDEKKGVAEAGPVNIAGPAPGSFSGTSHSQESGGLTSAEKNIVGSERQEIAFPVTRRVETDAVAEEVHPESRQPSPESPGSVKKEATPPKRMSGCSPPKSPSAAKDAQATGENVLPDVRSPAPHPSAKPPRRKRPHGRKSSAKRSKKGTSVVPSPERSVLSPATPEDVKSPPRPFAQPTARDQKSPASQKASAANGLPPDATAPSPRHRKATEKKPSAATVEDKKPDVAVSPSRKVLSPARKLSRRRKLEGTSPAPKAQEKKTPSGKASQPQPYAEEATAPTPQTGNAGNARGAPAAILSPNLKPRKGKTGSHKVSPLKEKVRQVSAAANQGVNALTLPTASLSEKRLTSPLTTATSHIASEGEEPNHAHDDGLARSPSPPSLKSPEGQRKRATGKGPGTPEVASQPNARRRGTEPVPGNDSVALLCPANHSPAKPKSPDFDLNDVPVASAQTIHGAIEVSYLASAPGAAMHEAGSEGVSQAQDQAEAAKKTDPKGTGHRGDRLLKSGSGRGSFGTMPGTDNVGSDAAGRPEDRAEATKGSEGKAHSHRAPKKENGHAGKKGAPPEPGAPNAGHKGHHEGNLHREK